tara:strand:- start:292 stop:519 length:228 start_codon:yes stop_codon:yes gene_type:complete
LSFALPIASESISKYLYNLAQTLSSCGVGVSDTMTEQIEMTIGIIINKFQIPMIKDMMPENIKISFLSIMYLFRV